MKKTKMQKGITLVALIITIVVLLILAIVTIGAVKDSNIIAHAENAKNSYTIAQEKEQIGLAVSEWQLQKVIPGNTKTFHEVVDEALKGIAEVIDNGDGTLKVIFDKTGNEYTVDEKSNITKQNADRDNGNEDNDDTVTGDFEIAVTQKVNYVTFSDEQRITSVSLTIKPIIPESWKHVYTEDERDLAARHVARYLKIKNSDGTEVTNLEECIIAAVNQNDELPTKFAKDKYNEVVSFVSSQIPADISTPEKFVVVLMSQMGYSFTTIQECATDIGYLPTTYSIKISKSGGEWMDITDNEEWEETIYEVHKNGTYEIQMQLDDKKSSVSIAVTDTCLGAYVKYDANGNGSVEDETILWRVLRNDKDKVELITAEAVGNLDLTPTDLNDARYKYNNAIDLMVAECKRVTGITENIRNVCGPATDTTTETVVFRNIIDFKPNEGVNFSQYEATEQNTENGFEVGVADEYKNDYEQMIKTGVYRGDNYKSSYWIASSGWYAQKDMVRFYVSVGSGINGPMGLMMCRINNDGSNNFGNESTYSYPVRPVLTLGLGVLDNVTQSGEKDDPIEIYQK